MPFKQISFSTSDGFFFEKCTYLANHLRLLALGLLEKLKVQRIFARNERFFL